MAKSSHTTTTPSVAYRDDREYSHTSQHNTPPERPPHARTGGVATPQVAWQMAHELRIPLTAMMGFAQMLLDPQSSKPLDQQQREYVDRILASGAHLMAVIDEMLDVAAIRAGRLTLAREPLAPAALLTGVSEQLAPLAAAKSQRVTIRPTTDLTPILVDPLRMRQVLLNLLGNAIKFAPVGSEIALGAQPAADGATDLFVQNQGPLIPRAYQRKIFEPFTQLPQPTSDAVPGTGLGLAIAQELVRLHHGRVWVRSNQRHGTTFWVRLPR